MCERADGAGWCWARHRSDDLRGGQRSREFLIDMLAARYEKRSSQIDVVNALSLYPDEVRGRCVTGHGVGETHALLTAFRPGCLRSLGASENAVGRQRRPHRVLLGRALPCAAQAEPAVPHAARLPAAQLQPLPSGSQLRDPRGPRRRHPPRRAKGRRRGQRRVSRCAWLGKGKRAEHRAARRGTGQHRTAWRGAARARWGRDGRHVLFSGPFSTPQPCPTFFFFFFFADSAIQDGRAWRRR